LRAEQHDSMLLCSQKECERSFWDNKRGLGQRPKLKSDRKKSFKTYAITFLFFTSVYTLAMLATRKLFF